MLRAWLELLRWDKPSGRLILLVPAGWALWLQSPAPSAVLVGWIVLGGLAVSGGGCVVNDLWDRRFDPAVERTRQRPLASGRVSVVSAWMLLILCILAAYGVLQALPAANRSLCLLLAWATGVPVLFYPSAKRWFAFPQLVLAFCWGFAVLIPWAAAAGQLRPVVPLLLAWLATVLWTFGFDTVYAMSDRRDDAALGLRSSALTLGRWAPATVQTCYGLAALALGAAAALTGIGLAFWPGWALATCGLLRESRQLAQPGFAGYGRHFQRQVLLGGLLLLSLILGRVS
ncbi:MAG: 4-hydroxybenzoate polyprenyltransferase [Cyanobacteriota bacterium]